MSFLFILGCCVRRAERALFLLSFSTYAQAHNNAKYFTMLNACSYEPAIALLLEVIQSSPNLPDPYHTLGLLYEQVCPTTLSGSVKVQVTADVSRLSAIRIHWSPGAFSLAMCHHLDPGTGQGACQTTWCETMVMSVFHHGQRGMHSWYCSTAVPCTWRTITMLSCRWPSHPM